MFGRSSSIAAERPAATPNPGSRGDARQIVESQPSLRALRDRLRPLLTRETDPDEIRRLSRKELAQRVGDAVIDHLDAVSPPPSLFEQRHLVTVLMGDVIDAAARQFRRREEEQRAASVVRQVASVLAETPDSLTLADPEPEPVETPPAEPPRDRRAAPVNGSTVVSRSTVEEIKHQIRPEVLDRIQVSEASKLDHDALYELLDQTVQDIRTERKISLNRTEHHELLIQLIDDMIGLGPLEPLLADEAITDIMVNGPFQIYVERRGKVELSEQKFQNDQHVLNVAQRIVTRVGRRVDESSPICDARLPDGSRVNVIAPPLAIDGTSISIRKFAQKKIGLDTMVDKGSVSPDMALLLKIAGRSRLNIVISGGTGSGKTTLLNALSRLIDHGERVVTIEDAAELQLQQPHVVRLETRPANLEGKGEVTMRDLVKNALRMRPDRIILGEVRGGEAIDMLQAMNTGHEGSMCTLHANRPRDALTRLENLVSMSGISLPAKAVRQQIASAVDMIVQVSRMRDGVRRITNIVEVVGMEGDVVVLQELFTFKFEGQDKEGNIQGRFDSTGLRPHFTPKAEYFGLDQALLGIMR